MTPGVEPRHDVAVPRCPQIRGTPAGRPGIGGLGWRWQRSPCMLPKSGAKCDVI